MNNDFQFDTIIHDKELGNFLGNAIRRFKELTSRFSISRFFSIYGPFDLTIDDTKSGSVIDSEKDKWFTLGTTAAREEVSEFSSRRERSFNQTFSEEPQLLPLIGGQNSVFIEKRETGFLPTPTKPKFNTVSRSFIVTPLCFVIFFVCNVLSYNVNARKLINNRASNGMYIPLYLREALYRVRLSDILAYRIALAITDPIPQKYLKALGFSNTVIDIEWLTSENGVAWCFDFFERLRLSSNNYIKFVDFTSQIQLQSGRTTTFTAISVLNVTGFTFSDILGTLKVIPGNSYTTGYNGVHLTDSLCIGQQLYEGTAPLEINGFSFTFEDTLSLQLRLLYIIRRLTGHIENTVSNSTQQDTSKPKSYKTEKVAQLSNSLACNGTNPNHYAIKGIRHMSGGLVNLTLTKSLLNKIIQHILFTFDTPPPRLASR